MAGWSKFELANKGFIFLDEIGDAACIFRSSSLGDSGAENNPYWFQPGNSD